MRRTRKYRTDALVHLAEHFPDRDRPWRVACTRYRVFDWQLKQVEEPATCLRCITQGGDPT